MQNQYWPANKLVYQACGCRPYSGHRYSHDCSLPVCFHSMAIIVHEEMVLLCLPFTLYGVCLYFSAICQAASGYTI